MFVSRLSVFRTAKMKPVVVPLQDLKVEFEKLRPILLRPKQAAAALGMSARALFSATKRGEIPCIRIGKLLRYSAEALKRWGVECSKRDTKPIANSLEPPKPR